jgi:hypothetical protein
MYYSGRKATKRKCVCFSRSKKSSTDWEAESLFELVSESDSSEFASESSDIFFSAFTLVRKSGQLIAVAGSSRYGSLYNG